MGEVVQREVERLLPIFEGVEKFKLLTPDELKRVVAKCKTLEYKLTAKPAKKESYLSYIEYLKNFSLLLHHRRGVAKFVANKEDIEKNLSIKIGNLYRNACRKFKSDVNLWMSRIDFVKSKKLYFSLGKIYFELLKFHTQKPDLWISAAQYELDINENIEHARSLLQRALRFNADSKQLWFELFRLELIFVDKIIKRKEILEGREDDKALENEDAILSCKLAFLVFRQALKQINEPSLCLDFIQLTKSVSLPFSEELIDYILEHVADSTPDSEEKCDCLITYAFDKGMESVIESDDMQVLEHECSKLYEQACEKFPSSRMICLHLVFLLKRYKYASDSSKNEKFSMIHSKFMEAASLGTLSEEMCHQWLNLCSNINQKVEALEVCVKLLPTNVGFRNDYLQALIEKNENRETIMKTFNECFDTLDEKECLPIWKIALDWSLRTYPEKIEEIFKAAFVKDTSISAPMKSYYLEYVCKIKSLKEMRVAFERLCNLKPNSWVFYQTYLRLEDNAHQRNEQKMRTCFEHAIFEFGSCNVDVWCDYVNFEARKDPAFSSQVYNRALKSLSNSTLVEEFVRRNLST